MFRDSKTIIITATLATLVAQTGIASAFEGGGPEGVPTQFQFEYSENENDDRTSERRRVPHLGELPFAGRSFRDKANERSNLLIQVQPHIVRGR
ncbi:MAG: hypothetical protein AB3N20_11605 [Rhizobiaceae bacterium]